MARTYRLRGVPLSWDANRVRAFLAENCRTEPPRVDSLAREVHGRSQSATVSFQHIAIPSSRQIQIPIADQLARPQVITIDDDFYGITTLYRPPPQNHKLE
jgi:hypothetical protein